MGRYATKYIAEWTNAAGTMIQLVIQQKDYKGPLKRIKSLQGLNLRVDGRQEAIDAPIVRSTAYITLVDCSDIPDTQTEKYGHWEEFYTSDATEYLVLINDINPTTYNVRTRWSGYVIPDSWSESLGYHGTITIEASDGLGALNEKQFDMDPDDGMVMVGDLITTAIAKSNVAMKVGTPIDTEIYQCPITYNHDGVRGDVTSLYMNVSAFEDMTWYEALEEVLNSTGMVLRYTDSNNIEIAPLRYLPMLIYGDQATPDIIDVTFTSGNKMMDPSFRKIVEKIDFGYNEDNTYEANYEDMLFRPEERTYKCQHMYYDGKQYHKVMVDGRVYEDVDYGLDKKWAMGSGFPVFLDTSKYPVHAHARKAEGNTVTDYLYYGVNSQDEAKRYAVFRKNIASTNCRITLNFASQPATVLYLEGAPQFTPEPIIDVRAEFYLLELDYMVAFQRDAAYSSAIAFWDGKNWVSNPAVLKQNWKSDDKPTSMSVNLQHYDDGPASGCLGFYLLGGTFITEDRTVSQMFSQWHGMYLRIKDVTFENSAITSCELHTTTTINKLNTACNVVLERNPQFGVLPKEMPIMFRENYNNAFYIKNLDGAYVQAPYQWNETMDPNSKLLPYPALIAQQIMTYHAASEAIIEGDFISDNTINFSSIYRYKGVLYMLHAGTLDFKTGRMLSCSLRSFHTYDEIYNK